jgi:DNA-binding transcriptional MerR regulator
MVYDGREVMHMLIGDVCACAGLTQKAVRYYVDCGLIAPGLLDNGYMDFSEDDAHRLARIRVLRQLGLSVAETRAALDDERALRGICARHELELSRHQARMRALRELAQSADYYRAARELDALSTGITIAERMLDAFPGAYGRFLALHFARFLGAPIENDVQREAYREVVAWLDGAPALPAEVAAWLDEFAPGEDMLARINDSMEQAISHTTRYMDENADMIREYQALLNSDEFRASPAYKLRLAMQDFCRASGYWDVFLPALRRLSPAYDSYQAQLARANAEFLRRYPQAASMYGSYDAPAAQDSGACCSYDAPAAQDSGACCSYDAPAAQDSRAHGKHA